MRPLRRRVPPHFQAGPGLAVWASGLLFSAALSAVVSAASLYGALTDDATTVQLRQWGVLEAEQQWVALHVDTADAQSGCMLLERELVRYQHRAVSQRIALGTEAVSVVPSPAGLIVQTGTARIDCPSDPGSDRRLFAALIEKRAEPRVAWHPGPDPRVAHLYR